MEKLIGAVTKIFQTVFINKCNEDLCSLFCAVNTTHFEWKIIKLYV